MSKICVFIAFVVIFLKGSSQHAVIGDYSTKDCGLSIRTPGMGTNCFEWHNSLSPLLKTGRKATLEEVPWLVHVSYNNSVYNMKDTCTGSIINSQWILTAAHCLFPRDNNTEYRIIFGVNKLADQNGEGLSNLSLKGIVAIQHPFYGSPKYYRSDENDLGLIKLEKPFDSIDDPVFKRHRSICLPERNIQTQKDEYAFTAGWGKLDILKEPPQIGSRQVLYMGRNADKYKDWAVIMTNRLEGQGQICKGDSGGPLWQYSQGRAVIIGVTSQFARDYLGCEGYMTFDEKNNPFTGRNMSIMRFVRVSKCTDYFDPPNFIDWILNVTHLN